MTFLIYQETFNAETYYFHCRETWGFSLVDLGSSFFLVCSDACNQIWDKNTIWSLNYNEYQYIWCHISPTHFHHPFSAHKSNLMWWKGECLQYLTTVNSGSELLPEVFVISHLHLSLYIQQQWFLQPQKAVVEHLVGLKDECWPFLPRGHLLTWAALCPWGAQGSPYHALWAAPHLCGQQSTGSHERLWDCAHVPLLEPLFHPMGPVWEASCCSGICESAPDDGRYCCHSQQKSQ